MGDPVPGAGVIGRHHEPSPNRPGSPSLRAAVLLGMLLLAPTIGLGFYIDDYIHQLVLEGDMEGGPMSPWALYDFGTWSDWQHAEGRSGGFPWWIDADWKARFFRPLSSLFLSAEQALFGRNAVPYHAVNVALFGFLIAACYSLYLVLGVGERGARMGALLVAVCDSAVLPVGWLANTNTLLVAVFSVISARLLLAHRGRLGVVAAGVSCAALAALSKEAGVVSLALATFLLAAPPAHADGTLRPRVWGAALGSALLCVAYLGHLALNGYGTKSLFYATPWEDPGRWLSNAFYLCTAGIAGMFGPFPTDIGSLFPEAFWFVAILGALLGLPILLWISKTLRGVPGTGFLFLWTGAFLLVQAGALPSDRLLFVASLGMAGLLGHAFERSRPSTAPGALALWSRRALWTFAVVGSGAFLFMQSVGLTFSAHYLRAKAVQTEVGSPADGTRDLLVLQTQTQIQGFSLPSMWAIEGGDRDLVFWLVQAGNRALDWTTVDEHTFELASTDAPFLTNVFESVYLTHPPSVSVGHTWRTAAFTVEALAVTDGAPTKLRFRTTKPLDDPTLGFLRSDQGVLKRVAAPAIGESTRLEQPVRDGPFMP